MNKGKKKDIDHEKFLMYGLASLWFSLGIVRFFLFFSDYLLEGTYIGDIGSIFQLNNLLHIIIYYFYEFTYFYMFINIIVLCLIFVWFSIKLKAEFKAISSIMAIGLIVILIGWTFEATILKAMNVFLPGISSSLIFIGILIATSPLLINIEFFYSKFTNWIIISLIAIIFTFLSLTTFTSLPLSVLSLILILISATVLSFGIIYIIYQVVKRIRSPEPSLEAEGGELQDFMTVFTKPPNIGQEDINFSIEKKRCIVCKSKISQLNYLCPKCEVLYCARCSDALSRLENSCWVCETPFDEKLLKEKQIDKSDIQIV
ncbi:MAG: hypothetical protein ACFFBV_12725 [Promethearchaeota archaeon]